MFLKNIMQICFVIQTPTESDKLIYSSRFIFTKNTCNLLYYTVFLAYYAFSKTIILADIIIYFIKNL